MTKLGRESKIDALTQLLKHSEFLSALEKSVKENPTQIVRIIILDIDRFRQFNSIYGRDAGDKILKKMAGIFPFLYYLNKYSHLYCELNSHKEVQKSIHHKTDVNEPTVHSTR